MPPQQQHNTPSPRPQPSAPQVTPHAPHLGYGSPESEHFQPHESEQHPAVPPPQPAAVDTPVNANPYAFIFDTTSVKSGIKGAGAAGSSFWKPVAFAIGGLVLLLAVAALVINALTPKGSTPGMISIAQRQEEVTRIASDASLQATSTDVKNFAVNVNLGVSSSQKQITDYLAAHKTKLNNKTLEADKSAQTDNALAAAATANNYDSAVTQTLVNQLQTYERLLQNTYKQTDNKNSRQLLQNTFNSADLLLRQGQAVAKEFGS